MPQKLARLATRCRGCRVAQAWETIRRRCLTTDPDGPTPRGVISDWFQGCVAGGQGRSKLGPPMANRESRACRARWRRRRRSFYAQHTASAVERLTSRIFGIGRWSAGQRRRDVLDPDGHAVAAGTRSLPALAPLRQPWRPERSLPIQPDEGIELGSSESMRASSASRQLDLRQVLGGNSLRWPRRHRGQLQLGLRGPFTPQGLLTFAAEAMRSTPDRSAA